MFELTHRNNNHHISTYNPFQEVEDFERSFFNSPFSSFFGTQDLAEFKTDVTDEGDHYLLEADLPGFEKKDIQLEISGDTLTVRALRHSKVEEKDNKDKLVRIERSYGSYSRQFDISGVEAERIKARYDNGVLKLTLPKKQAELPEALHLEIE
ncbi:MAG: Hsp20/alpha crystallin family protein [Oscillospiraceae bacterium]|nr:Hsp20/alpha crystallin family protein [Oscillospiraceae bacterium]